MCKDRTILRPLLLTAIISLTIICNTASSQLLINELLASNQNDILDQNFQSEDWIEVYNSGASPINLAGYYLSDDVNNLLLYQFPLDQPTETFILGGAHIIVWADNDVLDGWNHAPFKLTSDGETIYLTSPDGTTIVDQITYPLQQRDISYGRSSDGAEDWVFFNNTTPEESNSEVLPPLASLFINEVLTSNTNGIADEFAEREAWIEIYNPNAYQVNLSNYYLGTPGNPLLFQFPATNPALTTIDAGGFLLFWMDGETNQGESHIGFQLNSNGDELILTGHDGSTIINNYEYPSIPLNQSWGRGSDGGINSQFFNIPTPRYPNGLIIIEPETLYINEVLSDNVADTLDNYDQSEDWFEIYNPNPFPVNIGGYYLTDNPAVPMKFRIPDNNPDSTTIDAGGWLLFWADEDVDQGVNHVSFKLNNLGEQVILFGLDGFSLVDQITFGIIEEDQTLGRFTDGASNWVTFLETTPEASNNGAQTGILEREAHSLQVYPNPAQNQIFVPEAGIYQIYNSAGLLVKNSYSTDKSIDIQDLARGLYLIRSQNGNSARIILE